MRRAQVYRQYVEVKCPFGNVALPALNGQNISFSFQVTSRARAQGVRAIRDIRVQSVAINDPDESPSSTQSLGTYAYCLVRFTGDGEPDANKFFMASTTNGYVKPVYADSSCILMAGVVADTGRSDDFADGEWELQGQDSVWIIVNRYSYNSYNEPAVLVGSQTRFIIEYEIEYK